MAETLDALEDARKKRRRRKKRPPKPLRRPKKPEEKVADYDVWDPEGTDEEFKAKAEKEAEEAEKQAAKMTRKAAKAAAKAEIAAREAEASGVIPEDSKEGAKEVNPIGCKSRRDFYSLQNAFTEHL